MGLFSFLKPKQPTQSDAQVNWLNKVDLQYQRAFQVKNVTGLSEYLTRTCLSKIMEQVRLGEKLYSGLARYQHTSWSKVEESNCSISWVKEVTYDNVQMSHGVVIPVGDNTSELWVVVREDGKTKVSEIRRMGYD